MSCAPSTSEREGDKSFPKSAPICLTQDRSQGAGQVLRTAVATGLFPPVSSSV